MKKSTILVTISMFLVTVAMIINIVSLEVMRRSTEQYMEHHRTYSHDISVLTRDQVEIHLVIIVRGVIPPEREFEFREAVRNSVRDLDIEWYKQIPDIVRARLQDEGYVVTDVWQKFVDIICDDKGCRRLPDVGSTPTR